MFPIYLYFTIPWNVIYFQGFFDAKEMNMLIINLDVIVLFFPIL